MGARARIVGLIPAHNEADTIEASVLSLRAQTDQVVVVSDNSDDATAQRARAAGAVVVESVSNTQKKAGALNQVLVRMLDLGDSPIQDPLPLLGATDFVLVVDADSILEPGFVHRALTEFGSDNVGAVGGIFLGADGGGLLAQLQRNEYVRYARAVARRGARAWVLTGTASMFRVDVLRQVAAARRAGELPGADGVYDTLALTEDNELTLAIKTLGYDTMSPRECVVRTEVMLTWRDLWHQRIRWQRGALENLRHYGISRVTSPYLLQQAAMLLGLLAMWLFMTLTVASVALGLFVIQPMWLSIGAIFFAERLVTVWRGGLRARLIAAVIVVEFVYDMFLQLVLIRCLYELATRKEARWHHATKTESPARQMGAGVASV